MSEWQAVIRAAAVTGFSKTGLALDFRLARGDLMTLCREVANLPRAVPDDWRGEGFLRIQVRVFVPELEMQVTVDEWTSPEGPTPAPA